MHPSPKENNLFYLILKPPTLLSNFTKIKPMTKSTGEHFPGLQRCALEETTGLMWAVAKMSKDLPQGLRRTYIS